MCARAPLDGGPFIQPEEVTTRDASAEVDAREVGLSREGIEEIWSSVVRLYETGLHPAVALCLRRRGQVVLDRAIGHARGNAPGADPPAPRGSWPRRARYSTSTRPRSR